MFSDNLDVVYKKAREAFMVHQDVEFHSSFTAWEEHQIVERVETILKNKYSNSDEIVAAFQALCRSLQTTVRISYVFT